MNSTFLDSLDELYLHAKSGEDRTTRAGYRYENVVFVTVFTGRLPWQPAGILLQWPKISIFATAGKTMRWIEK